ncbi:GNAT family N-acetyltransferase [Nocardioides limicola]|uniref:GNAT family N-acetyltransferase n=1 Tax=Nocardioides limicola TaxID=2803368 RepID=UPI00193BC443|nr:GNAT family N-acetyltransferase [Nocardioides sp. DJM-14]
MAIEIIDNPDQSRYEAHLDGEVAGFAEYVLKDDRIVFTHTEVAVEGKGIGGALARGALDDVRAKGTHQVVPRCRFIKSWIEKHPDYADLVSD